MDARIVAVLRLLVPCAPTEILVLIADFAKLDTIDLFSLYRVNHALRQCVARIPITTTLDLSPFFFRWTPPVKQLIACVPLHHKCVPFDSCVVSTSGRTVMKQFSVPHKLLQTDVLTPGVTVSTQHGCFQVQTDGTLLLLHGNHTFIHASIAAPATESMPKATFFIAAGDNVSVSGDANGFYYSLPPWTLAKKARTLARILHSEHPNRPVVVRYKNRIYSHRANACFVTQQYCVPRCDPVVARQQDLGFLERELDETVRTCTALKRKLQDVWPTGCNKRTKTHIHLLSHSSARLRILWQLD